MIQDLAESRLLWTCIWQTTILLGLGLGLNFLFSRRPGRAHRVLVLSLAACLATPLLSETVRHFGWGLLRTEVRIVAPAERIPPPATAFSSDTGETIKKEAVPPVPAHTTLRQADRGAVIPPRTAVELSRLLIDRGVEIFWTCGTRMESGFDAEACRAMGKAGCTRIDFGMESANQRR